MAGIDGETADRVEHGFRLCLARPPSEAEQDRLVRLYEIVRKRLAEDSQNAKYLATNPLGPVPEGLDVVDAAAWTVVGNVLLNLDEMFMKR